MTASNLGATLAATRRRFRDKIDNAPNADVGTTAVLESGLRIRAASDDGNVLVTDMPAVFGGEASGPSAGTLLRAALACCNATTLAMVAAETGITLTRLEVRVDSRSDRRGVLGEPATLRGPVEMTLRYGVAAEGLGEADLRALVEEAGNRSPVLSALRRTVPVRVEIGDGED